jgi:hypothetical protein
MRGRWLLRALRVVVFVAAAVVVAGLVVMTLWNWLIPPLTGWHVLGLPQAIALLVLCRILFGGFRRRHGPWGHGRFRHMSQAEREQFRAQMRERCGSSWAASSPPAQS